jgi:hypothetical protein
MRSIHSTRMSKVVRNGRLAAGCLTLWLAACGGGGGGGSGEVVVLPPEVPAAAGAYEFQQVPDDMAGTGEPYVSQARVSALAAAPSGYEIEAADSVGGTRPVIDGQGVLTWTPGAADAGLRRFNLVVHGSDGTTARLPFAIQVAPWRVMVDQTFGQVGGNSCDASNQYCVTVAPDQVAAGVALLRVRLRTLVRADGGVALSPWVEGAVVRAKITFTAPDVDTLTGGGSGGAVSATSSPLRVHAAAVPVDQYLDATPLPNLNDYSSSWSGTRIKAGAPLLNTRASPAQVLSAIHPRLREGYVPPVYGAGSTAPQPGTAGVTASAFTPIMVGRLSGDCGGARACNKSVTPVLLVHGFNLLCNYSGGTGTWGRTDEFVRAKTGANVFEFQYRTCMRFEEAAGMLAEAVRTVGQLAGAKPLIVAHSFGGVVASTYLKGLAVRVLPDGLALSDEVVRYGDDVAGLITVGAPLSGIAAKVGTTSTGGWMTQGRDTADFGISNPWFGGCGQITCHQAGAEFSDNTNSTGFNQPETANSYYLNGLQIFGQRGDLIVGLRARRYPVPARILVANGNALPLADSSRYCDAGDGLIAVAGQAVDPQDFMSSPYLLGSSAICGRQPLLDARMSQAADSVPTSADPNVTYRFMMSSVRLPRSTYANGSAFDAGWTLRFAHTGIHRDFVIGGEEVGKNAQRLNLSWGEAADVTAAGRLFLTRQLGGTFDSYVPAPLATAANDLQNVIDVGEHPLATAIREVHSRISLDEVLKRAPLFVRGNFSYANAAAKRAALGAHTTAKPAVLDSAGADVTVPYTLQIFSKATGQSRARHSDRTDLQGNMVFDYGAWFERLEAVGVDFSKYYMVVTAGDPLACRPTVARIDTLTTDVALGQIKLCPVTNTKLVAEGVGNDRDALISPNGGEAWMNLQAQTVRWRTEYITGPSVDLYVLHDDPVGLYDKTDPNIGATINAKLWMRFAGNVPNTGTYTVDPAALQGIGNAYRVLVVSTSDNSKFDLSDANFSLNMGASPSVVTSLSCTPVAAGELVTCTYTGTNLWFLTFQTVGLAMESGSFKYGGTDTMRTAQFRVVEAGRFVVNILTPIDNPTQILLAQVQLVIGSAGSVPPPVPVDPAPGTNSARGPLLGGGALFNWTGSADAAEYELVVVDRTTGTTSTTRRFAAMSFLLADLNLPSGGLYQWSIAACNAAGCSAPTAPLNFRRE